MQRACAKRRVAVKGRGSENRLADQGDEDGPRRWLSTRTGGPALQVHQSIEIGRAQIGDMRDRQHQPARDGQRGAHTLPLERQPEDEQTQPAAPAIIGNAARCRRHPPNRVNPLSGTATTSMTI